MDKDYYFIVNSKILPPIFKSVIETKELLSSGEAKNVSQATKITGISRSAFYKYRDYVIKYEESDNGTLNISAVLKDRAGVFSALTTSLYQSGANIITVNQDVPSNEVANVFLTIKTDNMHCSSGELLEKLTQIDGIVSIKYI